MILRGAEATDPARAGGKGAALARAVAAGFDVPEFFVLPEEAFDGTRLTTDITDALKTLGPGPYAVRSSATAEDGAADSHAGQFATKLNVAANDVAAAAKAVRASGLAESVAEYRAQRRIADGSLPAVVVQRMVPARAAGVAFSADPVSGRRDLQVVSATSGTAEKLVDGQIDGETWVLGAEPAAPSEPEVLTPEEAAEVAALARRAEKKFGAPQDIEWAFDGDRLLLLQSRPITTPLRPCPQPDPAPALLDNSNIIESYPGLVSTLTFTFASYCYDRVYRSFVRLLGLSTGTIAENAAVFANLLTRVDGRVYYNLGNWYRALALLPGYALNRDFMETMMGVDEPLPADLTDAIAPPPATGLARGVAWAQMVRVGLGLAVQAALLSRTKRRFMARLDAAISAPLPDTLTGLAATYRRIEAALLDRWDAPLVNDFLCMVGFGATRKMLERWAGEDGLAFHNDIMIGQGGIVSAEPARRIADMAGTVRGTDAVAELAEGHVPAAIAADIDAYLAKFGDRCTEELKLESIPLSEDPAPLLAAIRAGALRDACHAPDRAEPDWNRLIPDHPVRRVVARSLTTWAAARVRDRENLRFERTRIFGHARRVFRAIGREFHARGWLDSPEDIFHLTVAETLRAIEGAGATTDLAALARLRKSELEAAATRPDPPRRIRIDGPVRVAAPTAAPKRTATGADRQGTGCSAGRVTATARVVRDPRTESLNAGEILVAANTDPGWIAVFANASAIVVERGSLLSHSAIVARELGIPCVVGVPDATDWVTSGETLTVDGATGRVEKTP
ncbi:phosphoenolpyruvate synthase [Rhodobacterales bacterium HKCCE3408]|nr:phosphoenolpyruvate synthase [Rhodobacterales bacterium HKCCE3408]